MLDFRAKEIVENRREKKEKEQNTVAEPSLTVEGKLTDAHGLLKLSLARAKVVRQNYSTDASMHNGQNHAMAGCYPDERNRSLELSSHDPFSF